jgi:TetR/AcrR family transcriptional regulator, transcriptional repressor for nem operon
MTDLPTPRQGLGKADRLVEAAREAFHRQGVEGTTLADIAQDADVPTGNVYYYFKTKDELIGAAVQRHAEDIQAMLASLERHRTPQTRLKAFIRTLVGRRELLAEYGCPLGGLCSDLSRREPGFAGAPTELVRLPIAWATEQFELLGRDDAEELAVALLAAYHGAALLTNTLHDPGLMSREGRRLSRWIDTLAAGPDEP